MSSIAQVRRVLKGQMQAGAAAFTDYWTDSEIERACRDCGHAWRDRFWTPLRTLWGFLLKPGDATQVFLGYACRIT